MQYIKLKDVQKPFLKLLEDFPSKEDPIMISAEKVLEIINSLPPHDPIAVLKEMIEEYKTLRKNSESERDMIKFDAKVSVLEEAISRITNQ